MPCKLLTPTHPQFRTKQLFLGGFPYANVAKPVDRLTSFILIKPTMLIPSCVLLAQIVNIMLDAFFYFLSVIVYTQKQWQCIDYISMENIYVNYSSDESCVPTRRKRAPGQWWMISGIHFSETLSRDFGSTVGKQTRKTSVLGYEVGRRVSFSSWPLVSHN